MLSLLSFYEKFAPFRRNPLWLTGESYAGIYIPWLARRVVKYNEDAKDKLPLAGMILGNACGRWEEDAIMTYVNASYFHALYSPEMHNQLVQLNCTFNDGWIPDPEQPAECKPLFYKFGNLTQRINPYDIYRRCYKPPAGTEQERTVFVEDEPKTYKVFTA